MEMSKELRAQIDAMMARIKAGETYLVDDVVSLYNTRQMDRRMGGYTVKGWEVIEA